jgi:hypothetical protein
MSIRHRRISLLAVGVALCLGMSFAALAWACTPQSFIDLGTTSGHPGATVTVTGRGFVNAPVQIRWNDNGGPVLATGTGPQFRVTVTIPRVPAGTYYLTAIARENGAIIGNPVRAFQVLSPAASTQGPAGGGQNSSHRTASQGPAAAVPVGHPTVGATATPASPAVTSTPAPATPTLASAGRRPALGRANRVSRASASLHGSQPARLLPDAWTEAAVPAPRAGAGAGRTAPPVTPWVALGLGVLGLLAFGGAGAAVATRRRRPRPSLDVTAAEPPHSESGAAELSAPRPPAELSPLQAPSAELSPPDPAELELQAMLADELGPGTDELVGAGVEKAESPPPS